ncbi:nucleotidyltransferase family protein [Chryseosolibacter indicus]|uniref:Nucleotidyltransferase n=1 Tax=Chryseosolibacter indicus TaxID=2782351 RepID=A0ABS5VNH0_9BACT|nr:sugar phosphate nucleotidyltransferase [Chryseosolibacter indicus]MBT1702985.1 nucleotidyltransferase [Chryseosolibacter indicus]
MDTPNRTQKNLTLLVLAAGIGSRYGGIKQIDGFGPNGETIMDYSLFDAVRAGFTKVVFIVRDEILEVVKEKFEPKLKGKLQVEFVIQSLDKLIPKEYQNAERVKPYGTGHAVLCAREVINEPFVVINADDFYGKDSFASVANFFANETSGAHAMVGYTLKNVLSEHGSVSRGVGEKDDQGFLKSVVERTTIVKENGKIIAKEKDGDLELSPDAPTSMNFWGFHPSMFELSAKMFNEFLKNNHNNIKAEFYIPLIANEMIAKNQGKIKVLGGGNIWFGVTYKEDKEEVSSKIKALIAKGEYPEKLWV